MSVGSSTSVGSVTSGSRPFPKGTVGKGPRGGRREGAGRKPGDRPRVRHRTRAEHDEQHPVHVVIRRKSGMPSFREQVPFDVITSVFRALAKKRSDFRIAQFSVQANHIHFVIEAHDKGSLSSGMRSLAIRIALRLNRRLGRRGKVWDDRYFRRDLTTPRQVRTALVYVLLNVRKHRRSLSMYDGVDAYSSARSFNGWAEALPGKSPSQQRAGPLVQPAQTALLAHRWRPLGLIGRYEQPRIAP